MFIYVIKLAFVLASVCGMAVGALWLLRKSQPHLIARAADRQLCIVETATLSPMARLAVVRFGDDLLLVSHGRTGVQMLASRSAGSPCDD